MVVVVGFFYDSFSFHPVAGLKITFEKTRFGEGPFLHCPCMHSKCTEILQYLFSYDENEGLVTFSLADLSMMRTCASF